MRKLAANEQRHEACEHRNFHEPLGTAVAVLVREHDDEYHARSDDGACDNQEHRRVEPLHHRERE